MSEPIKINGPKQLSFSERGHKKQHQSSGEFHELISCHTKRLPNVTVIELFKVPSSYARFMHTEMTAGLSGDNLSKIERRSALGRLAEAKDLSSVVLHLMGEAGRNITGQSIIVDAGNTA